MSTTNKTSKPLRRVAERARRSLVALAAGASALALALGASPAAAGSLREPMSFEIVEGRSELGIERWIQASGAFMRDTPALFEAFARERDIAGMTVVLESHGGSLVGGLELGRLFRRHGVHTVVGTTLRESETPQLRHRTICASACTFAFLGGTRRTVAPEARFGVHQFSWPREDMRGLVSDRQFVLYMTSQITAYLRDVDADRRIAVLFASAPADGLHIVTQSELTAYGIGEVGPARVAERPSSAGSQVE